MAMEIRPSRLLHGFLLCCLAATLSPALHAQDRSQGSPQVRPAPGAKPAAGPPSRPGAGNTARPQPGSRPQQSAQRPKPAQTKPARPGQSRPPARPQPGKPGTRPPSHHRPPSHRPPHPRPPQWGRPPQSRPSYSFRPSDRDRLRRYYAARIRAINRARRARFIVGGYYPYADIGYLQPIPPDVYGYLPPPPPGYQMGYYDGYVVVYDPVTYFITNLIDLLQ
jgi:hypothetical protein